MRKLVANEWMSLDGVIQSSGSDDDPTGGFRHGGWHLPYFDEIAMRWVVEGYQAAGGFLFGRRAEEGGDLHIVGSSRLTQSLVEQDLVDCFRLMIMPLVLGGGKSFLPDDGAKRPLRLVDSQVTTTGAILATYEAAAA